MIIVIVMVVIVIVVAVAFPVVIVVVPLVMVVRAMVVGRPHQHHAQKRAERIGPDGGTEAQFAEFFGELARPDKQQRPCSKAQRNSELRGVEIRDHRQRSEGTQRCRRGGTEERQDHGGEEVQADAAKNEEQHHAL